jgi:hypothetical protein
MNCVKEIRFMKKVLASVVVILMAGLAPAKGVLNAASAVTVNAGTVKVTVTYKGKGTVDASHKVWVWLFDTPNIGPGAMPIDQIALDKNGTDAVFENVAGDKVYVAVAFDEKGAMMGDGPPPTGTPIGILTGPDGAPNGITPGSKDPVAITFDDTIRMP